MNKIFSTMALLLLAGHAQAATIQGTNSFTYDGTAVTGLTTAAKTALKSGDEVVLPTQNNNGVTVVSVAGGAFADTRIAKLVIPKNYNSLEMDAFAGCDNLTEIHINGDGLLNTSYYDGNRNLGKVFPNAVSVYISADRVCKAAFYHHAKLANLYLDVNRVEQYAFYACNSLVKIDDKRTTSVESHAFADAVSLKKIDFPKLVSLEDNCFAGCASLESAAFPVLTGLNNCVFKGDAELRFVDAPNVTVIGAEAFMNCAKFDNTNPETDTPYSFPNLQVVGRQAFEGCVELTDAPFRNSAGLRQFGNRAFYGCAKINSAAYLIGGTDGQPYRSTEAIGADAFVGTSIREVAFPPTLAVYDKNAFPTLQLLVVDDKLMLNDHLTSLLNIVNLANDGTATLKVDCTSGLSGVCENRFRADRPLYLKEVVIGDGIGNISEYAFYGITADNISIGKNADFDCATDEIQLFCNDHLTISSPKIFVKNAKKSFSESLNLHHVFGWNFKTLDAVVEGVANPYCGAYAFFTTGANPSALERVRANWVGLWQFAFHGNSLMAYNGLENLRMIGDYALYGCNNKIFHGNSNGVDLGDYALAGNPLQVVVFDAEADNKYGKAVFDGVTPLMVYDRMEKVRFGGDMSATLMVTEMEDEAKKLRVGGYPHCISAQRMKCAPEDVDFSGSLTGDDAQRVYNAMK